MSTYTSPRFDLETVLQIGDEQQLVSIPKYGCRELVISSIFSRLISFKKALEKKDQKTGRLIRHPLKLSLSFSLSGDAWSKLFCSEERWQQLYELAAFACLVPALLAVGPQGVWKQESFASTRDYINLDCFSNLILSHPALVSVILGQARWACDMAANKELHRAAKKLKVGSRLEKLWLFSKKKKLSQKDRTFLLSCLDDLHSLGKLKFVRHSPHRYGILSDRRYKLALRNLLEIRKQPVIKSWLTAQKSSAPESPYSGINNYGFYTWARHSQNLKSPKALETHIYHKTIY